MLPTLSPHQEGAVRAAVEWFQDGPVAQDFFYLAGYAGTGKSTILPSIISALGVRLSDVAFCAPTGKAAKVMGEKLFAAGIRNIPTTIHSLIYIPNAQRVDMLLAESEALVKKIDRLKSEMFIDCKPGMQAELDEAEGNLKAVDAELTDALRAKSAGLSFSVNEKSILWGRDATEDAPAMGAKKLIVVDEASMVDEQIAADLMTFDIPILAIGDPGQLPPVRGNAGLTNKRPSYFLDEIHRQALDSPIIRLSQEVRNGKSLQLGNYGDSVRIIDRFHDDVSYDPDFAAQIICGTNKRRWAITRKLRDAMKLPEHPVADEPLIVCKNHKDYGLVNGEFVRPMADAKPFRVGDRGFPLKIQTEGGLELDVMAVQGLFEEHKAMEAGFASCGDRGAHYAKREYLNLDWGWAITCHKSQGSQWDHVIVHDEASVFRDDAARWRYTAITRAAKGLTVVV